MLLFSIVQIFYLVYLVGSQVVDLELKSDLKELDHLIRKLQSFSDKQHKNETNLKELEKELDGLDDLKRRRRREMPSTLHSSQSQSDRTEHGTHEESSEESFSSHEGTHSQFVNEPTSGHHQENSSTQDYANSVSNEEQGPYQTMFEPLSNYQHTLGPNHSPDNEQNLQILTEENPIMSEMLDESVDPNEKFSDSVINDISMPKKDGSPAFKIVASKVYILYPSMFQDPNIFGRFSIPQNVNMEGLGGSGEKREEKVTKGDDEVLVEKETTSDGQQVQAPVQNQRDSTNALNIPQPSQFSSQNYASHPYQNQQKYYQYGQQRQLPNIYPSMHRRLGNMQINNEKGSTNSGVQMRSPTGMSRRMANQDETNPTENTNENKAEAEETPEEKRQVETHLNGHIVVQNQDVNEYNVKHSY